MSRHAPHRPIAGNAREIAADWLMREEDGPLGPEGLAGRDAWLAEHPSHVAAYDALRLAMGRLDEVGADPGILALRASALSARPRPAFRAWRIAAAVAGALVLAGAGGIMVTADRSGSTAVAALEQIAHPGASVYRTAVGERSTVTLPDGSVATLNTDTVLRVSYTKAERGVRLVRGQALFEVAHRKELNRYSTERLVIRDPDLGAFHVTGVFKTGDINRFARTVEEILPVDLATRADGTTVLSKRSESISPAG